MKKLVGDIDISKIKRCYVEGAEITVPCPVCGAEMTHSFSDQYLMYPQVGVKDTAVFSCDPCYENSGAWGAEWELEIAITSAKIEIEYDPKDLKEC